MVLQNAFQNLAVESKQDAIITALASLLTELQQKYEGGAIALDAATLAALETIGLDAATLAALETITANISGSVEITNDVGNPLPVNGTVALDATTLAALETITVLISSGQIVGLDATTLAALENIVVSGTVALDAPTLAALETITAVVSGTVELGASSLAALESITAAVSGTVAVSGSVEIANDSGNAIPITDNAPEYWRIKNQRFTSAEEVRYDIPASLASGSIYTGVAADGTSTASAVWTIIRTYFDANGNPNRERIRTNVAWDSRTAGWT